MVNPLDAPVDIDTQVEAMLANASTSIGYTW
jgi:hypothetical protein